MLPRYTLVRETNRLEDEILALGNRVALSIVDSVNVLKRRDHEGARRLIAGDQYVNSCRYRLEGDCLTLIATQQPIAGDLRVIASMLEIISELERMSDYAKGIAKVSLLLGEVPLPAPMGELSIMAGKAQQMLQRSLLAFAQRDIALAQAIPLDDDEVDALYVSVYRELMARVVANPQLLESANGLLWVAHNLERTADRVTNICERVIFTVTGKLVELDPGVESPPLTQRSSLRV